jgi:diguanylate cyclase (GGDEF)-like protein
MTEGNHGERSAEFSRALVDAAKALTSSLKLEEVLETLMRLVAELLGPENWSLMLLDEDKQELYFEIVVGEAAPAIRNMRLPVGEGIAGWVAAKREPLVVARVADDERFCNRMDAASAFQTESILAVPLEYAGQILGVMEMVSTADDRRFTEDDLGLLTPFADFAAIAINNARNFRRIEDLTLTDEWTSLYNARFLHRCIEEEVERANRYHHPVSVVFLDLDHFKRVNDTHGHRTGSTVLREVADVLWTIVRNTDRPARYGGDEFVIVMPETDKGGATSLGERIRETIASKAFATRDGVNVRITASLGLATYPDDASDAKTLLDTADRAMYVGKARGRNVMVDAQDANDPEG